MVLARLPAIIEPVALTRDGVVAVLARTARFERALLAVLLRAVTPRDTVVLTLLAAPVPRELTVLVVEFARDFTDLIVPGYCAVVARAVFVVVVVVARGLVLPVRPGCAFAGTIGSANTERIDINVEHTKNAAANKNTVPMAFFNEFVFTRKVIIFSCYIRYTKTP